MTTAMSTRIAAGVTAAYVLDLSRHAGPAFASPARRPAGDRDHGGRSHAAPIGLHASRRARLGATRGGSSGCLG